MAVALIWFATCLFGALPFWLSGSFPSFVDCVFESASGFTTTGASILTDIEAMPKGVLFWRSFTHWLGGMGVLVLATAVLPSMGIRSHYLTQAETPGPVFSKLVPKQSTTSKILYSIYFGLTVVETVLLKIAGMPWYDAVIHALSSAGTGGFSNRNASVGAYGSVAIDLIITVFILLFSVNFAVYFLLLTRKFRDILASDELRFFLTVVAGSTLLIAWNIRGLYSSFAQALRYAVFQVASIISTTGFATADFTLWPQLSHLILILIMFCGACAGSTGGGMKCSRILILGRSLRREIHRIVHPLGGGGHPGRQGGGGGDHPLGPHLCRELFSGYSGRGPDHLPGQLLFLRLFFRRPHLCEQRGTRAGAHRPGGELLHLLPPVQAGHVPVHDRGTAGDPARAGLVQP